MAIAPRDPPSPPAPANQESAVSAAKDPRAVVFGVVGVLAILIIVLVVVKSLPGDVAATVKNTKGENAVALGSAAFTAISTMVTAYFGIKVANLAREETVKTSERHDATIERLGGGTTAR